MKKIIKHNIFRVLKSSSDDRETLIESVTRRSAEIKEKEALSILGRQKVTVLTTLL